MDSHDARFSGERRARRDLPDCEPEEILRPGAEGSESHSIDTLSAASTVVPQPLHGPGSRSQDTSVPIGSTAEFTAGLSSRQHHAALDDFTEKWTSGEISDAAAYLDGLGQVPSSLAVELIYREYCLAELKGASPDPEVFLARFPAHRELLERLFSVHRACSSSQLNSWIDPTAGSDVFPEAGDEIGPYFLRRELGRGAFARVFLAEQRDLENRLVILKLSTKPTREPWLLARARHSHIAEILSHAVVDDGALQLICMPFLGGATLSAVLDLRRQLGRPRSERGGLLKDLDAVAAPEYSSVNPARPAREILGRLTDFQAMAWITARLADALDHAQCREVIHGDVKPSNILLTADGNPMLLDFNLAQKWSFDKNSSPPDEAGGTLAYMAPERLRSLALAGTPPYGTSRSSDVEFSEGNEPHRADIYSLGIVLLEALTNTSPAEAMRDRSAMAPARTDLRSQAADYGTFRDRGAMAVIRAFESAADRKVPPALRRFSSDAWPSARLTDTAEGSNSPRIWTAARRPAAGLRHRTILGTDPASLCAAQQETALRRGAGTGLVCGRDLPGGRPYSIAFHAPGNGAFHAPGYGQLQAGPKLGRHGITCLPVPASQKSAASEPGRPRGVHNGLSRPQGIRRPGPRGLATTRRCAEPASRRS